MFLIFFWTDGQTEGRVEVIVMLSQLSNAAVLEAGAKLDKV